MRPLRITAHLRNGFSSADPWSPAFDGVIAYWVMRERLGEEQFALNSSDPARLVIPDGLPLVKVEDGDQWWWAASSPMLDSERTWRRYYHRRFDVALATSYLPEDQRGRVIVQSGPYKNYRNIRDVKLTKRILWSAIGDPAEITRLLAQCWWVGGGSAQGLGRVERWEVVDGDDEDEWRARYQRPLPAEVADAHGITGIRLEWGIRPPGRLAVNRMLCVLPVGLVGDDGDD